jgi:DNA-binding XRE family transcriptional regulator
MSGFKSNLQAMRRRAGFRSAREFAEFAGVNTKTYTNHEQGHAAMSLLQAWEYADILDCTLDELAGRRVPEMPSVTQEELRMVEVYRDASPTDRDMVDTVIDAAARHMDESALKEAHGA